MLILAALMFIPVKRLDIAELEPVEVVYLDKQNEIFLLLTDTGAEGKGNTIESAMEDMKKTTPAVVYLDTAEYLIVSPNALEDFAQMRGYMKDSVRVCCAENPDMKVAANYLDTHGKLPKISDYKPESELPAWNS